MGKLTEALKKVEKEREVQKQAWSNKNRLPSVNERKQTICLNKQRLGAGKRQVALNSTGAGWSFNLNLDLLQQRWRAVRKLALKRSPKVLDEVIKILKEGFEELFKSLEERFETLKERHKKRVYIAKTADNSSLDSRVVTHADPTAHISEQYRILRTNIISKSSNRSAKIFLISSALHGEGKTITAVNLAVTLAQDLDKKVFLGDCDLRGGNVHQLLNIKETPGLSDILVNGLTSDNAFKQSKIKNLTVLPRGEILSSPSELLSSRRMRRLLEELRSRFDYIILDSAPIIPITDASILGAQTDGIVLVVQAYKTQEHTVRRAQELLEQARAKIFGFVLTQADYYIPGYYSYYYQRYNGNGKKEIN